MIVAGNDSCSNVVIARSGNTNCACGTGRKQATQRTSASGVDLTSTRIH